MPSPRGVLSSVSIDFYGYGQPKLTEMARNQSVSVYFGFNQFWSVFGFPKRGLLRNKDFFFFFLGASNKEILLEDKQSKIIDPVFNTKYGATQ